MTRDEALARFDSVIRQLDTIIDGPSQKMGPLVQRFGIFLAAVNNNLKEIRGAL